MQSPYSLNHRIVPLFLLLLLCAGELTAQPDTLSPPDVQELVRTYIENIGGVEAWQSVRAIRMGGTASLQGLDFPLTITTAVGNKQRIEIDIPDSPMVQAFDGEVAWMIFPMQGITEPRRMTVEESQALRDTPFPSEFFNSAARGYTLAAVAGRTVNGSPTYGLRVTNRAGYDYTYYFDPQRMLPVMKATTVNAESAAGAAIETYLSDYRSFEGLLLPLHIREEIGGRETMTITISEVEINPELAEDFFSIPR
ncbi:outer membrane lipoprotein-sorting protein [Lewinella aquimaris]|uniref:Outer membrane lipoprotein-sorting protein n=1 Tax=Neolewinella aquimaris TaxID=1835722 RepID=A0A840E4S0_9BACT|nr:hypothetical protein [Neolewinella aquimaris]MBB4078655.1 outer membrane lipoprotein-sorting protein [Neolewinella aquimaris]